jgi:hypothetical protein
MKIPRKYPAHKFYVPLIMRGHIDDEWKPTADAAAAANAAALICAAALAAVAGGELDDPQIGISCTAGTGKEILAQLAESEDFEMVEPEDPHEFKDWEQEPAD